MANLVDGEDDMMKDAATLDQRLAALAVEREGHRQDGLEGIALRATRRRAIGLPAANARCVVLQIVDGFRREARSIVGDRDSSVVDRHVNHGRDARLFASVERVIDQFLEHGERPFSDIVARLIDKFALRTELA